MTLRILTTVACLGALSLSLVHCSSESNGGGACPAQCPVGNTCSAATGFQCMPTNAPPSCAASGCGANAVCGATGACACSTGFVDCNQSLAQTGGGDGCECQGACQGTTCTPGGACGTSTAGSCGGTSSYCDIGGSCAACPAGKLNCDLVGPCEATGTCGATPTPTTCSPSQANACGKSQYCNGTACATCPVGKHNCDGINDCESATPCGCDPAKANDCGGDSQYCTANRTCDACPAGKHNCDGTSLCESSTACTTPPGPGPAPGGCDAECYNDRWASCVKNPARNNYCSQCLQTADCTRNTRSKGTTCDTSDLAGTGINWCICAADGECANNFWGRKCLFVPNGNNNQKFKQCGCESDADCPASSPNCMTGTPGYTIGKCTPRCTQASDCDGITAGTGLFICSQQGKCEDGGGP